MVTPYVGGELEQQQLEYTQNGNYVQKMILQ